MCLPSFLKAQALPSAYALPSSYTLVPPTAMPQDGGLLYRLTDSPQDITSRVTLVRNGSNEVCKTAQDMQLVFPLPLKKIRDVLVDYARYPEYFTKVKKSEFTVDGGITRQTQTTSVAILGFEVKSVFTINLIERPGASPNSDLIQWYQVDSDHSIENIQGYWYLQEFLQSGKPATYVRYSTASEVPKTIVGQDLFMGMFLSAFARDSLSAVRRAAEK